MKNHLLDYCVALQQKMLKDSKEDLIDKILSMLKPGVNRGKIRENLRKALNSKKDEERVRKGLYLILENIHTYPNHKFCQQEIEKASQLVVDFFKKAFDHIEELHQGVQDLAQKISDESLLEENYDKAVIPSLASLLGISPDSIATFYEIGTRFFKEEKFEEATSVFKFLTFLSPYTSEIWQSLGMSAQKMEEWGSAIYAYSMASALKPAGTVHLRLAECFIAIQDWEDGKQSFHTAEILMTTEEKEKFSKTIQDLKQLM